MMFFPLPNRPVLWKCPKCGKEIIERPNPWIHFSCLPRFLFRRTPKCPRCGTAMIKTKLYF